MDKDDVALLGMPLVIREDIARDPFRSSMMEFIRHCIYKTAAVLHHVVVFTYNKQTSKMKKRFYLTGYESRNSWKAIPHKVYGNPETVEEGKDIKWLLKNLRWHLKDYALQLDLYEDVLEDITGFLLYDVIQKGFNEINNDKKVVADVFDACLELCSAVVESTYYQDITSTADTHRKSIEGMLPKVTEYEIFVKKQESMSSDLDSEKVIDFLQNKSLMRALKEEAKNTSKNPIEKPLTNFFLHTVIPRIDTNSAFNGDSGIVADLLPEDVSMESSMVIIDRFQSTPVAPKNKNIDRVKAHGFSGKQSVGPKTPQSGKKSPTGSSDHMDGSFVLI